MPLPSFLSVFPHFQATILKETENKLGLSCAKLRQAYTSYPLGFGLLAYAEAAYYVQQCLLELAAAEKKLLFVGVIMSPYH